MNIALSILVALVMIGGGVAHLIFTANFEPLVPSFLPATPVIVATGALQIAIGVATLWPKTRAYGGIAFTILCLAYMPLHLWDFVRENPVFAPPVAATIRVVVQLFFIWVGYTLWQRTRGSTI